MIYSVLNNHSSYEANSKYYGAGAFNFMSECAKDELEIFENAIITDMHEVVLGESSYEMEAINEGFFENVWKKIKEIFKKFMDWIRAVARSAVAKLANLLIRDNKEFAKFAKEKIKKMKNKSSYEYSGTYVKNPKAGFDKIDSINGKLDKISDIVTKMDAKRLDLFSDAKKLECEKIVNELNDISVTDLMEDATTDGELKHGDLSKQIEYLEDLSKTKIDKIKRDLKKHERDCDTAIKKVERLEKAFDSKEKYDKLDNKDRPGTTGNHEGLKVMDYDKDKKLAANGVTICNQYKTAAQTVTTITLSYIKSLAKAIRTVVAHAAGATPKKEGFEYDDDALLFDAMNEAVLYEYDEALESMGESKGEKTDTKNVDSEEEFDEE